MWKLTERIVDVPVVQKEQIQQPDTGSEDPKVQTKMFRTSRLQKIVNFPQVDVIDEVAKVPRSMRRQVPMIQELQKDPKPEEVQISFSPHLTSSEKVMPDVREARVRGREQEGSTRHVDDLCAHV